VPSHFTWPPLIPRTSLTPLSHLSGGGYDYGPEYGPQQSYGGYGQQQQSYGGYGQQQQHYGGYQQKKVVYQQKKAPPQPMKKQPPKKMQPIKKQPMKKMQPMKKQPMKGPPKKQVQQYKKGTICASCTPLVLLNCFPPLGHSHPFPHAVPTSQAAISSSPTDMVSSSNSTVNSHMDTSSPRSPMVTSRLPATVYTPLSSF
jgi:hypothetical protein